MNAADKRSGVYRMALSLVLAPLVSLFFTPQAIAQSSKIRLIKPIKSSVNAYYEARISRGLDVYVGANYLFQVMKLRSQLVMQKYEQEVLFPKLFRILQDASKMQLNDHAFVFISVALKLAGDDLKMDPQLEVSVNKIADQFMKDASNVPRGHYTKSDELKRYFLVMQFLTKAVFDVDINKEWYAARSYLVFPFDAWESLWSGVTNPSNSSTLADFIFISDFYDTVSGRSDLPNLSHLIRGSVPADKQAILDYARSQNMPRINREAGVGAQLIGERFTVTQWTVDDLSQTFLANNPKVSKKEAFATLRFKNILMGRQTGAKSVAGLDGKIGSKPNSPPSYYESALRAVFVLKPTIDYRSFVNLAGASMTALGEQTVLTVKESVLVPKTLPPGSESRTKTARIFFQDGIADFVKKLAEAESIIMTACESPSEITVWEIIMNAASRKVSLTADSEEGASFLEFLSRIENDPTVSVDVFHFNGQFEKGYLQWGIVPYEALYSPRKGIAARGVEMVFFEGWNDQADKRMTRPLTNEDWRKMVSNGKFTRFTAPLFH